MARRAMSADGPVTEAASSLPEQGFYRRWSQRKAEYVRSRSTAQQNPMLPVTPSAPQQQAEAPVMPTADEHIADEHMEVPLPSIDSLTEHSDLSEFMHARVADEIRLHALRKVFHTPRFNVCDGLDDYAENYRNFEPLGDIITADLRYQLQRLKKMTGIDENTAAEVADAGEAQGQLAEDGINEEQEQVEDRTLALNTANDPAEQGPQSE